MGLVERHLVGEPAGAFLHRAELVGALQIIVAQIIQPLDLIAEPEVGEGFGIGEGATVKSSGASRVGKVSPS